MEALVIELFSQIPTVAGLVWLTVILRDELRAARTENADNQHFMQSVLLLILDDNPDPIAMSRARSALRSKVENP